MYEMIYLKNGRMRILRPKHLSPQTEGGWRYENKYLENSGMRS